MATNPVIDPDLLNRAPETGGEKTKKATVIKALEAYVDRRAQLEILDSRGKFTWDPDYDHKASRHARDHKLGLDD